MSNRDAPRLRCELVEAEPEHALPALALGDVDLVLGDEWQHQPLRIPSGLERHELLLDPVHLVLPARRNLPQHHVDDECTIHCLEGDVEVAMPGGVRRLGPGQLVLLPARQPYSLGARVDSAVLMTLLLNHGDAGDGGGRDAA